MVLVNKNPKRYTQNMEGTFLPYRLIELSHNQGFMKALGLFIAMKKLYRNGVFYSPTCRKLADETGYNHTTVNTHLKTLIKLGLVEYRIAKNNKKQLLLKGYKYLVNKWGKNVRFIHYNSKSIIYEELRAQIAISHIKSQEYNIRRKQKSCNCKMKKFVESTENYARLSDRKLAEIMNVSNASANRLKKRWVELGFISLKPIWSILAKSVPESVFKQAKAFGDIPVHAIYQKNGGRILIRRPDSVFIGTDCNYKLAPLSWEPSFSLTSDLLIMNIKQDV